MGILKDSSSIWDRTADVFATVHFWALVLPVGADIGFYFLVNEELNTRCGMRSVGSGPAGGIIRSGIILQI